MYEMTTLDQLVQHQVTPTLLSHMNRLRCIQSNEKSKPATGMNMPNSCQTAI